MVVLKGLRQVLILRGHNSHRYCQSNKNYTLPVILTFVLWLMFHWSLRKIIVQNI